MSNIGNDVEAQATVRARSGGCGHDALAAALAFQDLGEYGLSHPVWFDTLFSIIETKIQGEVEAGGVLNLTRHAPSRPGPALVPCGLR